MLNMLKTFCLIHYYHMPNMCMFICARGITSNVKIMSIDSGTRRRLIIMTMIYVSRQRTWHLVCQVDAAHLCKGLSLNPKIILLACFTACCTQAGFYCLCKKKKRRRENRTSSRLHWRPCTRRQTVHASAHETANRDTCSRCTRRTMPTAA